MKILIYGTGAVGLGLASSLIQSGEDVDLLGRGNTVQAIKKEGLKRIGILGAFSAEPVMVSCFETLDSIKDRHYDFILVCTKSFDTETAAKDLSRFNLFETNSSLIVLCQNGWGNHETFAKHFPKHRIRNARVITGFKRPKPNIVDVTVHAEPVHLGDLFGQDTDSLKDLAKSITAGGLPCEVTHAIGKDLWAKMLYNCALNPLGTLLNVSYGLLGESTQTCSVMNGIFGEVFEVMGKAGFKTHWTCAKDYQRVFYEQLLPSTYKHESSMLQDIRAQKQTEVEAMNGAIVRLGHQCDTPTPFNLMMYRLVKFLESGIRDKKDSLSFLSGLRGIGRG